MSKNGLDKGAAVNSKISSFLYRFRGCILGLLAIALVVAPPSLFPKSFELDKCVVGILIAVPLFVASAILRVRARQFIGEHTRGKIHDADKLVTVGVYSRVRHPLYISNTGFAVGFTFALVVVTFEVALARIEDRFLEDRFGEAWRAWARVTPAFFPHLASSTPHPTQRSFLSAFFADRSTWLWLLFCNLVLILRKVVVFYA